MWWKIALAAFNPSGAKFPKWHFVIHFYDFTTERGSALLSYTGSFEKSHRFLCKLPYLRTGRKVEDVWEQIVLRVVLADRVVKVKVVLESVVRQRVQAQVETLGISVEGEGFSTAEGVDVRSSLQNLLKERYPAKYAELGEETPEGAQWDKSGYVKHGLV